MFRNLIRNIIRSKVFRFLYRIKTEIINPELNYIKGREAALKIQNKGKDLRIHGEVTILNASELLIGDYVRIGRGCFFSCSGGLTIGHNTQISRNVVKVRK